MKRRRSRIALAALAAAGCVAGWEVMAGRDLVRFPADHTEGVHYATVMRGAIRQELYASRAAIDAAKSGQPFPSGTVITLADYREGRLHRYVVMEKRDGWGSEYPPDLRNGNWEYQVFAADRTPDRREDTARCFACHKSRAGDDFVWTADRMRAVP